MIFSTNGLPLFHLTPRHCWCVHFRRWLYLSDMVRKHLQSLPLVVGREFEYCLSLSRWSHMLRSSYIDDGLLQLTNLETLCSGYLCLGGEMLQLVAEFFLSWMRRTDLQLEAFCPLEAENSSAMLHVGPRRMNFYFSSFVCLTGRYFLNSMTCWSGF